MSSDPAPPPVIRLAKLNLIGTMDTPSSGSLVAAGVDLNGGAPVDRAAFRRDTIGFIFQFYNLFPTLTAAEKPDPRSWS